MGKPRGGRRRNGRPPGPYRAIRKRPYRGRRSNGIPLGVRGRLAGRSRPPPVTYQRALNGGPKINMGARRRIPRAPGHNFRGVKMPSGAKGFTMDCRVKLGTTRYNSSNVYQLMNWAGSVDLGGQFYIWPTNTNYFPPSITNFVRCFEWYKMNSFHMEYEPRIGTQSASAIICGYFQDCNYFESRGVANSATLPDESLLINTTSCKQWPAWKPMQCPSHRCVRRLASAGPSVSSLFAFTDSSAAQKQSVGGVYGVLGIGNPTPGAAIIAGDIYLNFNITVWDMVTINTTGVTFGTERKFEEVKTEMSDSESRILALEQQLASLKVFSDESPPVFVSDYGSTDRKEKKTRSLSTESKRSAKL